jgi:cytochrome oxidase assembly protein ShyY1
MSTDWESTWDAEQEGSSSALKQLLPLIAVVLLLVGLGAWQAQRRRARKPRGIQRIVAAVNESELSEQAKQVLRDSVDEVSGMLATLRSSASELTAR